jgi:hypothetical protein
MKACLGLFVIVLTLSVAGCGSSGNGDASEAIARCESLTVEAGKLLEATLPSGSRLVDPVAVRSHDFTSVYFVAAYVDGEPALWVMNRLDGTGLIYSVNDHAFDVSGMGRSEDLADPITEDDDGASEALYCV